MWWDAQLASVKARYPHRLTRPRPDYFGLHLLSRFELVEPEIRFLIDGYVPSIRKGVRLPSGALIDFHGVHPKPPPYQDTAWRTGVFQAAASDRTVRTKPSSSASAVRSWLLASRLSSRSGDLVWRNDLCGIRPRQTIDPCQDLNFGV